MVTSQLRREGEREGQTGGGGGGGGVRVSLTPNVWFYLSDGREGSHTSKLRPFSDGEVYLRLWAAKAGLSPQQQPLTDRTS